MHMENLTGWSQFYTPVPVAFQIKSFLPNVDSSVSCLTWVIQETKICTAVTESTYFATVHNNQYKFPKMTFNTEEGGRVYDASIDSALLWQVASVLRESGALFQVETLPFQMSSSKFAWLLKSRRVLGTYVTSIYVGLLDIRTNCFMQYLTLSCRISQIVATDTLTS